MCTIRRNEHKRTRRQLLSISSFTDSTVLQSAQSNGMMFSGGEVERIWKEAVKAPLDLLFQNWAEETDYIH
jgi:hypothetical protein